jgi:hypothetical protein
MNRAAVCGRRMTALWRDAKKTIHHRRHDDEALERQSS